MLKHERMCSLSITLCSTLYSWLQKWTQSCSSIQPQPNFSEQFMPRPFSRSSSSFASIAYLLHHLRSSPLPSLPTFLQHHLQPHILIRSPFHPHKKRCPRRQGLRPITHSCQGHRSRASPPSTPPSPRLTLMSKHGSTTSSAPSLVSLKQVHPLPTTLYQHQPLHPSTASRAYSLLPSRETMATPRWTLRSTSFKHLHLTLSLVS